MVSPLRGTPVVRQHLLLCRDQINRTLQRSPPAQCHRVCHSQRQAGRARRSDLRRTGSQAGGGPRPPARRATTSPRKGGGLNDSKDSDSRVRLLHERATGRTFSGLGTGYGSAGKQPERCPRGQDRKAGDGFVPRPSLSNIFRDWHQSDKSRGAQPRVLRNEKAERRSPGSS